MPWRKPSNYEYMKTHTTKDWGWEFIRRDARYIEEWEKHYGLFIADKEAGTEKVLMPVVLQDDLSIYGDFHELVLQEKTLNLTNPNDIDGFLILSVEACKWKLRAYQNPESKKLNQLALEPDVKTLYVPSKKDRTVFEDNDGGRIEYAEDKANIHLEDYSFISVINLKQPLAPQLETIKKITKTLQSSIQKEKGVTVAVKKHLKTNEFNIETWIAYLRCLDAKKEMDDIKKPKLLRKTAGELIFTDLCPYDGTLPENKFDSTLRQAEELGANYFIKFMI